MSWTFWNEQRPTYIRKICFRWFLKVLVSISSLMHSCSQVSILPGKDNDSRNIIKRIKLVFINCLCTKCIISFKLKKSSPRFLCDIFIFIQFLISIKQFFQCLFQQLATSFQETFFLSRSPFFLVIYFFYINVGVTR